MTLAHDSDFVKLCLEIPHDIEHVPDIDIIVLLEKVEDPVTEIDRCSESLWQI